MCFCYGVLTTATLVPMSLCKNDLFDLIPLMMITKALNKQMLNNNNNYNNNNNNNNIYVKRNISFLKNEQYEVRNG